MYSVDSLYEVMKSDLVNLLYKRFLVNRGEIVTALAFEQLPFDDNMKIVNKLGDFILEMSVALEHLGVKRDKLVDQVLLDKDMALIFTYDNIRDRDVYFILKVKEYRS
jgi:hypothetical protein